MKKNGKKIFLAFSGQMGVIIWGAYTIINRFMIEIPDRIAYPVMAVTLVLMVIGVAYNGYCWGKKKNPYDFR